MYGQLDGGHHTYRRGYLTLPNETAWDDRLSYNALGLLAHLMARNPNGPMGYRNLMRPGVGEKAILGGFRELVAAGYRMQFRRQIHKPGKRPTMVTDTYHSEDPRPLEWYVAQHKKIYGIDPIFIADITDLLEDASKAALASVSGAHKSGALKRGARKRAAQQKAFQPLADAEENNQGQAAAVEPQEAQEDPAVEQLHCLGCDAVTRRQDLDDAGQCGSCLEQIRQEGLAAAAAAAEAPAVSDEEAAAATRELFQKSLERQAKRLHISVEELVAMREQAGQESPAAVALGIKGCRSAPAHDRSGVAQK
jgi:hypothetical protein